MKKKLLVLSLSALLLTGCSLFSFSEDKKPEGFDDEGNKPETRTIEYYDGDTFDKAGHIAHVVTFKANEENNQPVLANSEEVLAVMNDADSFVTEVTNISNVAQFHGLKVGHLNDLIDGTVSFTLAADISAVEIKARPRSSVVSSLEAMVEVIDQKVAINVNKSKYIKVKCDYDKISDIVDSTLTYKIEGDVKNIIDITAVHERAEIMQITFYE